MKKQHQDADTKAWIPLGETLDGFDQTNGVVDLSEAERASEAREYDESDMLSRGAASNAASMGWSGGF